MEEKENAAPITVLAIGGAGCRVIGFLADSPLAAGLRFRALDTDASGLEASGLKPESCLLAGARWRSGRGCGGNVLDGQRAVAHERADIERLIAGAPLLLVVGGLGGGTASGGVPVVLSVARKLGIPALFLLTLPFTLEGHSKRKIAEDTVRNELLDLADAVICLPNDLLFSVLEPTTPLAEAFRLADSEVSRTVLALTAVLRHGNLLAPDFGSFVTLLRKRKSFCSIGIGVAERSLDGDGCGEAALERLLHSPLLGGAEKLGSADAVIFSLLGGPELSIGETRLLLELAGRNCRPEARLIVGAATGEEWRGMIQLCAVTVKFDAESEISEVMHRTADRTPPRTRGGRSGGTAVAPDSEALQLDLPLQEPVSKGIMEKTAAVFWRNEDLDIPTYARRNVIIDNGKHSGE